MCAMKYQCTGWLLSSFLQLVLFCCERLSQPAVFCEAFSVGACLAQGQPVSLQPHQNLSVCIVTKRDFTETILVVIIFLTSLSKTIKERSPYSLFGILSCVYCISSRTVHKKNKSTTRWCEARCFVHKDEWRLDLEPTFK